MSLPPPAGYGPYPGSGSFVPAPTRRLEFGTLFTESFRILRAGLAPFLLLGLITAVVTYGGVVVFYQVTLEALISGLLSSTGSPAAIVPWLVGFVLLYLVGWLVQLQAGAMVARVADDVADGRPADLAAALRATSTIVPRMSVLFLVMAAGYTLVTIVVAGGLMDQLPRVLQGDEAAAASFGLAVLGLSMVAILAGLVSFLVAVKLFLFLPVAAIEGASMIRSVTRSWELTRGVFWLLLGAQIVTSFAVATLSGVGQLAVVPLLSIDESSIYGPVDAAAAVMPTLIATSVLTGAIAVFAVPFLTIMSTVAYRYQARPQPAGFAYPAAPQPWAGYSQGHPGGYPLGGYPQPGYPQAGYPPYGPSTGHPEQWADPDRPATP